MPNNSITHINVYLKPLQQQLFTHHLIVDDHNCSRLRRCDTETLFRRFSKAIWLFCCLKMKLWIWIIRWWIFASCPCLRSDCFRRHAKTEGGTMGLNQCSRTRRRCCCFLTVIERQRHSSPCTAAILTHWQISSVQSINICSFILAIQGLRDNN